MIRVLPPELWKEGYAFLRKYHDPMGITSRVVSIYEELL
jgi:hypothetical protein